MCFGFCKKPKVEVEEKYRWPLPKKYYPPGEPLMNPWTPEPSPRLVPKRTPGSAPQSNPGSAPKSSPRSSRASTPQPSQRSTSLARKESSEAFKDIVARQARTQGYNASYHSNNSNPWVSRGSA